MTDDEYETHIDKVIIALTQQDIRSADGLAAQMQPGHAANKKVFEALRTVIKGITVLQLDKALNRKAAIEAHHTKLNAVLGCTPTTERELVRAFIEQGGYNTTYGGDFIGPDGLARTMDVVLRDIQLTASDLGLHRKPYELKDKNFERALTEWHLNMRETRLAEALALVNVPLDPIVQAAVMDNMMRVFGYFYKDPVDFALASVRNVVWQVKRRMLRLPVPEPLMTVLYGREQRGGKSTFWTFLKAAIRDMCKVMDVAALVSDAQFDLFRYFIIDTDEMPKADRANLAKLKNALTATTISRRVFFTQLIADTPMLATCVGSCNVPLASLITDQSGMRRFNELCVKPRTQIEPHWQDIVQADWLGLWRSVDAAEASPLRPFETMLRERQERTRNLDRVETWLAYFDYNPRNAPIIRSSQTSTSVQFEALKLFGLFAEFERVNFPGTPMTLGNWGIRFKALIDSDGADGWQYHCHGRRTIYTYTLSNVISLTHAATSAAD